MGALTKIRTQEKINKKLLTITYKLIMIKALGLFATTLSPISAFELLGGSKILRELNDMGYEADTIANYGCYCQFKQSKNRAIGEPMDEHDLVCFQYTQCIRCLEIDGCPGRDYAGYDETNEFCDNSQDDCGNMLCKCQKKLIQDLMNLNWSGVDLSPNLHQQFDHSAQCLEDYRDGRDAESCCGTYPSRYPFSSQSNRSCCGSRTYNPMYYECCGDNIVKLAGTC